MCIEIYSVFEGFEKFELFFWFVQFGPIWTKYSSWFGLGGKPPSLNNYSPKRLWCSSKFCWFVNFLSFLIFFNRNDQVYYRVSHGIPETNWTSLCGPQLSKLIGNDLEFWKCTKQNSKICVFGRKFSAKAIKYYKVGLQGWRKNLSPEFKNIIFQRSYPT